jgi:hypothetical protein
VPGSNTGEGREIDKDMQRIKECKNVCEGTVLPKRWGRKEGRDMNR